MCDTKLCIKCNKQKDAKSFKKNSNGYVLNTCPDCQKEYQLAYQAKYRKENPDRIKEYIKNRVRSQSGIKRAYTNKATLNICQIRGCHETVSQTIELIGYCKSHAFDKLNE